MTSRLVFHSFPCLIHYGTLPSSISYSLSTIPPIAPIPCLISPCPSFSLSFIPQVPPIPGLLSLRSILNPVYYTYSLLLSHNYPLLFPVFFPSITPYSLSLISILYFPVYYPFSPSSPSYSLYNILPVRYIPYYYHTSILLFPVYYFYSVSPIPCTLSLQSLLFPVIILYVLFTTSNATHILCL